MSTKIKDFRIKYLQKGYTLEDSRYFQLEEGTSADVFVKDFFGNSGLDVEYYEVEEYNPYLRSGEWTRIKKEIY